MISLFWTEVLNLVQIKGIKFCFEVFFPIIQRKKQNMNGISLKLVAEYNFVTKSLRFFPSNFHFFDQTYQLILSWNQRVLLKMFLNNKKNPIVCDFLGVL